MPTFRVIVDDVGTATEFYTAVLGFKLIQQMGPAFASVSRDEMILWLSGPESSAARPMPDGRKPQPGGWNRIVLEVDDIAASVADLRRRGARFRNEIVSGPGGQQIVVEDPAGNPVELFQARR